MTGISRGRPLDVPALREALEHRFRTQTRTVEVGGRALALLSPANADELIDEEEYERDERLPYWADLWPSALVLANEVRTMRLAGERVLELGCGLGIVAAAAAMAGGQVTATDYYEDALRFATVNVHEATGATIATRMVDWTAMPTDLGRFDVVLASDVLYEHRYAALVAGAIAATLVRGGEAVIADPGRIAVEGFLEECRERGLVVSGRSPLPFAEGEIRQTVTLYRLRWGTGEGR